LININVKVDLIMHFACAVLEIYDEEFFIGKL
jgi:hypothetical protein